MLVTKGGTPALDDPKALIEPLKSTHEQSKSAHEPYQSARRGHRSAHKLSKTARERCLCVRAFVQYAHEQFIRSQPLPENVHD